MVTYVKKSEPVEIHLYDGDIDKLCAFLGVEHERCSYAYKLGGLYNFKSDGVYNMDHIPLNHNVLKHPDGSFSCYDSTKFIEDYELTTAPLVEK